MLEFYYPNHNIFGLGRIHHVSVYIFFYLLVIAAILVMLLINLVISKKFSSSFVGLMAFVVFGVVLVFQTINQGFYISYEMKRFAGKTTSEKKSKLFGYSYYFAVFCRQHLKGRYQGKLITDFDVMQTLEPYILAYHLYPVVDLLLVKDHPKNCLIFFNKRNAGQYVPENYKILAVFDENSLVAVKKDGP